MAVNWIARPSPPGTHVYISDRDGKAWDEVPIPPRRHECWPQTSVVANLTPVWKCPCGALSPDGYDWLERNTRGPGGDTVPARWRLGRWWR